MKDTKFLKVAIFTNSLVPLLLMLWDWRHNRLGANPVEFVTRTTGMLTLIFLLLGLAITPLRKLTGFNPLIKFRRMIGLFAFFYGALHLITYVWFDRFFQLTEIVQDTFARPFILVGMFSFLLMIPLAVTSTNKMIKRLGGKRWNRLHKSVYAVALGGVLHYYLIVKADTTWPLIFALALALLLGYRVWVNYADDSKAKPLSIAPPAPPRR